MGAKQVLGKTLAERCARTCETLGIKSILETKPIGKVDVSKLGVCLSDGTVCFPSLNMIRYRTAEEAEAQAKKIVMRQFKAPIEQQTERMTATVGADVYIGPECGTNFLGHYCVTPYGAVGKKANLFHNHPACTSNMDSNSLSVCDIEEMIIKEAESITAFNINGEYCTAKVIDINKAKKFFNDKEIAYLNEHPEETIIRIKNRISRYLWADLDDEITRLSASFDKILTEEQILTRAQHTSLKRMLPTFGIEYKTNFSNLLKYDA